MKNLSKDDKNAIALVFIVLASLHIIYYINLKI